MKKLEIPVPKPYPVHVIYYKHISEDDPPPPQTRFPNQGSSNNFYFKDSLRQESPNKNKYSGSPGKYSTLQTHENSLNSGHSGKFNSLQKPSSSGNSGKYNSVQYVDYPTSSGNLGKYNSAQYIDYPSSSKSQGKYHSLQYNIDHPTFQGSQVDNSQLNQLNSGKFTNLKFAGDLSVDPGFPDKYIRLQYGSEISPSAGQYSSLQLGGDISPNLHHDYQYSGY